MGSEQWNPANLTYLRKRYRKEEGKPPAGGPRVRQMPIDAHKMLRRPTVQQLQESRERIRGLEDENNALRQALNAVMTPSSTNSEALTRFRDLISNTESQEQAVPGASAPTSSIRSQSKEEFPPAPRVKKPRGAEKHADSSVGSPGRQDILTHSVDYGQGSGAGGFVGKRSPISWIARAARYLFTPANSPFDWLEEPEWLADAKFSCFVDDNNVLSVDEDLVNALQPPSSAAISVLSEAFFQASEPILNLVAKAQFLERSTEVVHGLNNMSWEQHRWLASANLMWAIGAKWLHMAKLQDEDLGIENHLVYYARARALGLDHRIVQDHPNVGGVQALGLLSFYLWVNGSINRAWSMVGLAIRHATGLGLHLKTTDPRLGPVQFEERANTWYSLYNLEVMLSEILGRPTSTAVTDMTAPMASYQHETRQLSAENGRASEHKAVWEIFLRRTRDVTWTSGQDQTPWRNFSSIANHSPWNHHFYYNRLCTISHLIERSLYGPQTKASWLEVQQRLSNLQRHLTAWENSLPRELNLWGVEGVDADLRVKISLALYHQSLKMTLYRSCLCELDIPDESDESREFNMSSGQNCIRAAMSMMDILPELPAIHEAVRILPWWNLLHYLSQALSVFVLELCIDARHLQGSPDKLETYMIKAMSYLQCLAPESRSSYRAWRTFRLLLSLVNGRVPTLNIADIPSEIYKPPGWRSTDEVQLLTDLAGW